MTGFHTLSCKANTKFPVNIILKLMFYDLDTVFL